MQPDFSEVFCRAGIARAIRANFKAQFPERFRLKNRHKKRVTAPAMRALISSSESV
jgi:hypothetical protein